MKPLELLAKTWKIAENPLIVAKVVGGAYAVRKGVNMENYLLTIGGAVTIAEAGIYIGVRQYLKRKKQNGK